MFKEFLSAGVLKLEKYINFFTDYGFKKLFGEESNKDLLLDFLNHLLGKHQGKIKDITYLKAEEFTDSSFDRKAVFDLYCENEKGENFIVELQKPQQDFFKDRVIYYSSFSIQKYAVKNIYVISLLDFLFNPNESESEKFRYDVKLMDVKTNKTFNNQLTFIYFEMPKFNKTIDKLETHFDKWLFALRNLNKLDKIPKQLQEEIFEKLFETAEIANFTPAQVRSYEDSLKNYRDLKNSFEAHEAHKKEK